jgi:uncharacterized protein
MPFKSLTADNPLTNAELDRLEALLTSCAEKDSDVMGLEELDGFLTALIVNPELVAPSEYFPLIFGENHIFEIEEEAEEIAGLILRHHNAIATTLAKDKPHMPVFTDIEDDLPRGNEWAHGFLRGTQFSHEEWSELMNNEEHGGCVLPMLILENEHNPDPELRPPSETMKKREEILVHMTAGVVFAYRYFKQRRQEEAEMMPYGQYDRDDFDDDIPLPVIRSEPKIGRNDPCPCGSGKKYKRCHGGVTVH